MGSVRGGFAVRLVLLVAVLAAVGFLWFGVILRPCCDEKQARCTSNLKVLGMAMMAYADDYDGVYPPSLVAAGSNERDRQAVSTIVNALDPYLNLHGYNHTRAVWRCPAQRGHGLYVKSKTDEKGMAGTVWPLQYVCNRNLLRPIGGEFSHYRYLGSKERAELPQRTPDYTVDSQKKPTISTGVRTTEVELPALTIALLEWHQTTTRCPLCAEDESVVGNISRPEWINRASSSTPCLQVHSAGLNVCFADGHVKWFRAEDIAGHRTRYHDSFYPD